MQVCLNSLWIMQACLYGNAFQGFYLSPMSNGSRRSKQLLDELAFHGFVLKVRTIRQHRNRKFLIEQKQFQQPSYHTIPKEKWWVISSQHDPKEWRNLTEIERKIYQTTDVKKAHTCYMTSWVDFLRHPQFESLLTWSGWEDESFIAFQI